MTRPTRTLLDDKARLAVLNGVNAIFEPVRRTFGPQGRNALLYRSYNRGGRITNDGYTVAECQEPKNISERLAAAAFKEACKRTNEKVGDGTTGTAIVAGQLFNDLYIRLSKNSNAFSSASKAGVMTIKRELEETAEKVKEAIKEAAVKVTTLEELTKIATVSVEDPELGKTIASIAFEVGVDGFIDVVEGYKGEIETEVIKGMRFPAKIAGKAFVNNPARYEMVAQDCPVFITNYALDNVQELAPLFQAVRKEHSKLIVVAPSFSDPVLIGMLGAARESGYVIYPVKAPSLRTEQFDDLAVYCGAVFFDKARGKKLNTFTLRDLGFLEKLIVKDTEAREDAVATGGNGAIEQTMKNSEGETVSVSYIKDRVEMLKGQLAETKEETFKKLMERRIASMASAVGVVRVGDSTQASSLYRKLKIEDAVYACKAALRGGSVKGGGLCLKEIADKLPEGDLLKNALLAPYDQIQSSVEGGIEIPDTIIDPAEAVYYAVEHAVGVVANLITVDIITPEEEDPIPGEGELMIARAINRFVVNDMVHNGQIQENQREMELDRMGGLSVEEKLSLDNG